VQPGDKRVERALLLTTSKGIILKAGFSLNKESKGFLQGKPNTHSHRKDSVLI
jgi:hypothetical protein